MIRKTACTTALLVLLATPAFAQNAAPASPTTPEKPSSPELSACKATAMAALTAREPEIKDIYIDEDGLTIAVAETKVEDTPVTRIIMGEAYLKTDKSDKPRRFLCLLGEKNKVLLTFFTQR
ncbi:MAG: hypothetical protein GY873_37175 [Bosea sp.]|uniref:hypothetical protein n=1 Tax=Bosea sp. (in: a-proteobacteria) TaxID=1871050 RepID=UPI0023A06CED|nr:hypothetical protein [Bosea sp. (in: a-proteobacteria)]MCP4739834.1 hypothetical protein [Bosea sp. (in: a-proteobacteria)]